MKKKKELSRKVASKICGGYFIIEKNENIFWFVNDIEYHHREMGLSVSQEWGHMLLFRKSLSTYLQGAPTIMQLSFM